MCELKLETSTGTSTIYTGADASKMLGCIDPDRTLVVVDPEVIRLHENRLSFVEDQVESGSSISSTTARKPVGPGGVYRVFGLPTLCIPGGEESKNLNSVGKIWEALANLEADRTWTLVAIGGGSTSDIAGFAAATYMRGIPFGFLPTTLLAQCDAAVGGKNAINHAKYKNLAGTFRQPDFVVCNPDFLQTIPALEYRSGFAEVIKHAVLASETYFYFLEKNVPLMESRDHQFLAETVRISIEIKSSVVQKDPDEKGLRKILNFGHTIGHGIELIFGLSHGEAVAIGMNAACMLAKVNGILPPSQARRIQDLLEKYGLPLTVQAGLQREQLVAKVMEAVKRDKKRNGDQIDFILPEHIGKVTIVPVPIRDLERAVRGVLA